MAGEVGAQSIVNSGRRMRRENLFQLGRPFAGRLCYLRSTNGNKQKAVNTDRGKDKCILSKFFAQTNST